MSTRQSTCYAPLPRGTRARFQCSFLVGDLPVHTGSQREIGLRLRVGFES